jgi:hypothetical protein
MRWSRRVPPTRASSSPTVIDTTPIEFSQRSPLPNCGEIEIHGLSPTTEETYPASAIACLQSPAGGEFVRTLPTTEGDPITAYFRVSPGAAVVELWVDSSRDRFGNGGWEHRDCPTTDITAAGLRMCAADG